LAGTDPIHQFVIYDYFDLFTVGGDGAADSGITFSFTNSALFMVVSVVLTAAFLLIAASGKKLVPSRLQLSAELLYEFIANTLRSSSGTEGMRFFPLVFSLFMFILFANLWGMFPYFFTVTSHIIVTFALAMLVIMTVIIVRPDAPRHPASSSIFIPSGVPMATDPAGRHPDRDRLLPVAADQPLRPSVRQHARRPHHAEGVRRLHRHARHARHRCGWIGAILPLGHDGGAHRPRTARVRRASLCVCRADIDVPQRRGPSVPLTVEPPPRQNRRQLNLCRKDDYNGS
jgi:ATP synthase subunit 6